MPKDDVAKIIERIAADPALARAIAEHPRAAERVRAEENKLLEVPAARQLARDARFPSAALRITGPVAHIRNVIWKEVGKIVDEVMSPKMHERDTVLELADDLRVYANELEDFGRAGVDPDELERYLREP